MRLAFRATTLGPRQELGVKIRAAGDKSSNHRTRSYCSKRLGDRDPWLSCQLAWWKDVYQVVRDSECDVETLDFAMGKRRKCKTRRFPQRSVMDFNGESGFAFLGF